MSRTYKQEDQAFYEHQMRLAKYKREAIEECGFSCELFVPPGGWRTGIDKERSQEPFPNQLLAAYRIFYEMFCAPNQRVMILLAAWFQGGKTGVLQALTRLIMTNAKKLQNRYGLGILTAMSDISWLDQTCARLLTELKDQIYHLPTLHKLEKNIDEIVKAEGHVKNMVLIDDESRIGSRTVNRKGTVLNLIKTTSPYETWRERGIRYLFVDATDAACALNIATLKQHGLATSIRLELPPSYLSIEKLNEQGRIHSAYDLRKEENVVRFYKEIQEHYGTEPLWHLIRMPPIQKGGYTLAKDNLEKVFGQAFTICRWDSEEQEIDSESIESGYESDGEPKDINTILEHAPLKPTLILIKNMFYAGKTLTDTHVGAMHDRCSERDDVTGQSFAGRASGHNRSSRTRVWTNVSGITRLCEHWRNIIQWDDDCGLGEVVPRVALNRRMPNIEVVRPIGQVNLVIRTTGEEISRNENLTNCPIEQLPNRLKEAHMEQLGPFMDPKTAIQRLNQYYNNKSRFTVPREKKEVSEGLHGFHVNSRLLSWYRKRYSEVQRAADLRPAHKLTLEQFQTIAKTFGCSSRKGQPYVLYPVYPTATSAATEVQWYLRFVKKEFTKFGKA